MTKPVGSLFSALILCAWMSPLQGASPAESFPSAAAAAATKAPATVPAHKPAAPAAGASRAGAASKAPADPGQTVAAVPSQADPKKRFHRPAPLKRLIFSARQGFSLRMVSSQDVTAEIRNGAGRTLARGAYTLGSRATGPCAPATWRPACIPFCSAPDRNCAPCA